MKNRRNTRRGRAKRWSHDGGGCWKLRGLRMPETSSAYGGGWNLMFFTFRRWQIRWFPNRAAAMRAAEHLARGRR